MTSNKQITPVKILKGVLVFALGVGVYLTERSYRLKNAEARSQARRSLSSEELVQYLQKDQRVESTEVSQKLKVDNPQPKSDLSVYIMKVKPQAVLWKQRKRKEKNSRNNSDPPTSLNINTPTSSVCLYQVLVSSSTMENDFTDKDLSIHQNTR